MKAVLQYLLLTGLAVLISGCKLAVINIEGGEVQSKGYGVCIAGKICIVDVNEPYFSETFTAVAEDGWYFEKWNRGAGFFCGGSIIPTCDLSFLGNEDSEIVEDMIESSDVFYLMPVFKRRKDIIAVGEKEWLQPTLFSNLTWDSINTVCPKGTCATGGRLRSYDMTGWTWASVEDVNALFNQYLGAELLGPGPSEYIWSSGEENPPPNKDLTIDFHIDGWRESAAASITNPNSKDSPFYVRILAGWASDRGTEPGVWAYIEYVVSQRQTTGRASTNSVVEETFPIPEGTGAWFWRPID